MKLAPIFQAVRNIFGPSPELVSIRNTAATLETQVASLTAERNFWAEQLRAYANNHNRLTPFTENLTGELAAHRDGYRILLKEPMAKVGLKVKIDAVAQLDLTMTPGEPSPLGRQYADFNRDNINKSKGGLRNVVESMCWGALLDGYSVSEKVKGQCERGKWRGKVMLQELKAKDTAGNRIQLVVDEFKNVKAVKANTPNGGVEYDPENYVIFTYLKLFSNPLGMSDLRAAIRACECKLAAIQLRMIFLDKFTGPYLKGKHNNEATRAYMETALAQARASGYITVPEGSEVEVLNLALSGTADFKAAIDDFDREILIGLTGASLPILEGQTPAGRGDTAIQRTTSQLFVWHLAQLCADAINDQIVRQYTDWNFPGKPELPVAALGGVNPQAVVAELGIGAALRAGGVPTSKEQWYEKSQWGPPKSPEDEIAGVPVLPGGDGFALPGLGGPDAAAPTDQAPSVASTDLRATVGGSQQIAALQNDFYSGKLPREAAVANATILFGFTAAEAEALFPTQAPVKLAPPDEKPIDPNAPPAVPFDDATVGGAVTRRPFLTWAKSAADSVRK